jgi:predicted outer membrane repeat protein
MLPLLLAGSLSAGTFRVNTTEEFTQDFDGKCSLSEAIKAFNDQNEELTPSGCFLIHDVPGNRIILPAGQYDFTSEHAITQSMDIIGAGMDKTVITADFAFSVSTEIDFFHPERSVNPDVTMDGMTIKGVGTGGALGINVSSNFEFTSEKWLSSLWLNNVRLTNFIFSALFNDGGYVQLTSCLVHNNKGFNGGGIRNDGFTTFGGYMYIYSSAIYNNAATESEGGGIRNLGGMQILHSTISGNTAKSKGGGIYMGKKGIDGPGDPFLDLWHCTIANNKAPSGGGVYITTDPGLQTSTQYSIIANNFQPDGTTRTDFRGPLRTDPSFALANLVRSTTGTTKIITGTDITGQDPKLGSLTSDNGCAWTPGCITYTHRLNAGSPAIDKAFSSEDLRDQRGFVRPVDGNAAAGDNEWDLGAYEYDPALQNERLAVANSSGDAHSLVFPIDPDHNGWTKFSSNATGDYVTYTVLVPSSGTYQIKVRAQKNPDAGKFQTQVAASASGTYSSVGSSQDIYASSAAFTERTIGTTTFSSSGRKYVRFKVTGRNGASSGSKLYFDYIKLVKQ